MGQIMSDDTTTEKETGAAEAETAASDPIRLPDDHPLVKTLAAQKSELKEAREAARVAAEKVRSFEDRDKSDLEKATSRADAAEKRLKELEAASLRSEVALAKGLSAAEAKRISGSTREELEADADELLELLKSKKPGAAPSSDGQGKTGDAVGQTKQITSLDELEKLSPAEQLKAYDEGRLASLGGKR